VGKKGIEGNEMESITNEIQRDLARAVRSLLNLAVSQQGLIEQLYRAHDALLTALTGSEPQNRPVIDPAAAARARREVEELQRMFDEQAADS
jgi:hypothetical protein